ncbi:aldo/keto reductase [Opitutaceae bacterium EW11]|nr:aldo/keto reductase [Opitutaceae bacterium EW11]
MKPQFLAQTFSSPAAGLKDAVVTLNNGARMPWLGLGVWQIPSDDETERVVATALSAGYRSIDTAALYRNERGVGNAIRASGVPREQLFVTTKVWNDDMRADRVEQAFDDSLRKLGLDYVDLYLLHWPIAGKIVRSWQALERLQRGGQVKSIGVSNFMIPHLEELFASARVSPAVNQIEYHPYLQSRDVVAFCRSKGIQMQAWSPLMQGGRVLTDPVVVRIAETHRKTPAQVVLRWDMQGGVITIPKSVHASRIRENADVFNFELSDAEMAAITALERAERTGADPFNFNF